MGAQGVRVSHLLFSGVGLGVLLVASIWLWRASRGPLKRHVAHRSAVARSEAIMAEATRRIEGMAPNPYPTVIGGTDYLKLSLFAAIALLVPAILATTKSIPDPYVVRPGIGRGDCLDRYMNYDATTNWHLVAKVDCTSPLARTMVTKIITTEKSRKSCWRAGMSVRSGDIELCVRPMLKVGMCVPAWTSDSEAYAYFSWARECGYTPPDPPPDGRPGKAYEFGSIRLVALGSIGKVACDRTQMHFKLPKFKLEVCAVDA